MKTFLNACPRALLALVLVHVVASHAVAQPAPPFPAAKVGSAEHMSRLFWHIRMIQGLDTTKKSEPVAKTATEKEAQIQALKESMIACGAVVRYIMAKEKMSKDEQKYVGDYVRVYINLHPAKDLPLLKGLDEKKMRQFIERDEVQAWIEAGVDYTKRR